jgi:hypothetical protein
MRVAHEHDCNLIPLKPTPIIALGGDAAETENLLIPFPCLRHVIGLEHRNQGYHSRAALHFSPPSCTNRTIIGWAIPSDKLSQDFDGLLPFASRSIR